MIYLKTKLPVTTLNQERLFIEFIRRHEEFTKAKFLENVWFCLVLITGVLMLSAFVTSNNILLFSILLFGLFVVSILKYLKYKENSEHNYINFYILKHHILGKLDVGFCNHSEACSCVDNIKNYVWVNYGISLYDKVKR